MAGTSDYSAEILVALRRIIRAIDLHSKQLAQTYGLTGPQLVVLKELAGQNHSPTGALADRVSLSHATVTGIVDRLQRRGLVERSRSATDRRQMVVSVTEEGRAIAAKMPSLLQERFVQRFSALPDWQQTQLLSSLQRMADMMQAEAADASPILVTGPVNAGARETLEYLTPGEAPHGPGPDDQQRP